MLKKTLGIFLLLLTSDLYAINGLEEDEYLRCGEVDDLAFGSLFFLNAETGRAYQHGETQLPLEASKPYWERNIQILKHFSNT